jgi:hypothetical protein
MTKDTADELNRLAAAWREKATSIELKYKKTAENLTNHVVAALEACAEDLEQHVADKLKKGT